MRGFLLQKGRWMMPRARSPKRDEAYEIYKKHKGNIENRRIAEQLGVDERLIAKWKHEDKWLKKNDTVHLKTKSVHQSNERCTPNDAANKKNKKATIKSIMENDELSPKEAEFCLRYSKTWNATKSYMSTYGCEYFTAASKAHYLLKKDKIKNELAKLKQIKLEEIAYFDESDIVEKHLRIAGAEITDFVEFGNLEEPQIDKYGDPIIDLLTGMQKIKSRNIVKLKKSNDVDGSLIASITEGREGVSVKMIDKQKSLEFLAKRFLAYPLDKKRCETDDDKVNMAKALEGMDKIIQVFQQPLPRHEIDGE